MKKLILVSSIMLAVALPSIGRAATVGNIAETQGAPSKFSLGLEYDKISNRDLEFTSGSITGNIGGVPFTEPIPSLGDSIKDVEAESNRIFLKGTLGFHSHIDLFVKLGIADAKWESKYVSPGSPDQKDEFDGDYGFAWGVGAKLLFFQSPGGLRILGDTQYIEYEVEGDYKTDGVDLAQALAPATYESKTKVKEWQVALYVNKTFGPFSPYLGIKYSDLRGKNETDVSGYIDIDDDGILDTPYSFKASQKAKADDNIGAFVGTDIYVISNQLSVNIEGRFLDETAGTVGVNWKF